MPPPIPGAPTTGLFDDTTVLFDDTAVFFDDVGGGGAGTGGFLVDVENATATADFPTLLVQVAFFSDPLDNVPQWTDLTGVCRLVTINRGRSFELDDVQAGTASFTFNNMNRNLDPTYTGSPYYDNVNHKSLLTARRRIRLSAIYNGITYPRFDGFVDSWPQVATDPSHHFAETVVTATDLFGWISLNNLSPITPWVVDDPVFGLVDSFIVGGILNFPSVESCGSRVDSILDLWPLPASMRQVDDGNTQLVADPTESSGTTQAYLDQIVASEGGRMFVTRDGALAFQARNHWQTDDSQLHSQMVLSDQVAPSYSAVTIDAADERYIRNRIVRGRGDMPSPLIALDPASIRTTGTVLEDSHTDLLTQSTTVMTNQAKWLLAKYANPAPRFASVTINPQRFPTQLFPPVLSCDLGDRITVAHTLVDIGAPMVGDYWIEQIQESWAPLQCTVIYSLAPVDTTTY